MTGLPHGEFRSVNFYVGLTFRVVHGQYQACSEVLFEFVKCVLLLIPPLLGDIAHKLIQGFADCAEVLDEALIIVCKAMELPDIRHVH